MSEEKKHRDALAVYETLRRAVDELIHHYECEDEDLVIRFTVTGEDLPMPMTLRVDEERMLVILISPLPFKVSEEKRVEGAIMTCEATSRLLDGSFDYDFSTGRIAFRMAASYRESLVGKELFSYMVLCAYSTVDEYNDRFFMINQGMLSLEDFLKGGK